MFAELLLTTLGAISLFAAGVAEARGRSPVIWSSASWFGFFITLPYLLTRRDQHARFNRNVYIYFGVAFLLLAVVAFINVHALFHPGVH